MREFIGSFFAFLRVQSALTVEVMSITLTPKEAQKRGYKCSWLENDSPLVCSAFHFRTMSPWFIRNRWNKCIAYCKGISFKVSHILKEGDSCANKLANLGFLHR